MTIRVAAIEVSHWHALNDAAYLRHLVAMPDVELVGVQDGDAGLVARRAAEVGNLPTFTDPATNQTTGPCPGYIKDHIVPLACGGPDSVANLQWQTIAEAKAKDKWERMDCRR